jgi:hypothetical protein
MPIDDIGTATSVGLRDLLNLGYNPSVTTNLDESDRAGSPSNGFLMESSKRVLCSLAGHDEQVAVTALTIPTHVATEGDSYSFVDQTNVSIRWHFRKSPLCWALVAAVALGIARSQGAEIEDNSGFFTSVNVQGPDEFCQTLRLSSSQSDLDAAAEALYSKMPKSAEVTDWLKRQYPDPDA